MEIIFENVSYIDNAKASNERKYLNDVSFKLENNKISAVISDYSTNIGELISAIKRPSIGSISVDGLVIKHTSHIENVNLYRKRIAFVKCSLKKRFLTNTVEEEIRMCINNYLGNCRDKNKRVLDSLKMVGLNETFAKRNPNELSSIEQKKVIFACSLSYNPEVIVFENYETGMNYKEKENLKKMLRLLKVKYNKTIVILSNDMNFLMDLVDNYVVINKGELVLSGSKKVIYSDKLYEYVEMPKIIEFIKYANEKGHQIEHYTDIKELIKGIYRDVE